jgi:uncharacterized Zn finger protein
MSRHRSEPDRLDEATLEALAGLRSFARGEEYAASGAVGRLELAGEVVLATVHGSHPYRVRLGVSHSSGRSLTFSCSCPVGVEGGFCKHCVAVGLCWLREGCPERSSTEVVREHLLGLSAERLVDILLDHAREDPRLAGRLDSMVLRAAEGHVDLGAYRALLDRSLTVHGYVSYGEAWGYFEAVDSAIDALFALQEDGHAGEVVELVEHAVRVLDATSGQVDDSDGGTTEVIERLEKLHHTACEQAHVDPVELAERLFAFALESDLGVWSDALQRYAGIFGAPGMERYRELVDAAWAASQDPERNWLLTSLAEQLARQDGDIERLVAIRSRDVKDDWGYLRVVEVLLDAGREDDALQWAERGVAASKVHHNTELRDFVARAYRRSGRVADAVRMRVQQFADTPSLTSYQALKRDAEALGEWPQHRERALAALRSDETVPGGRSQWARRDSSTLVEILSWEGDEPAAWEAAHAGGCSPLLWRALAQARAHVRPQDTVAVYRRLVAESVQATNNRAYENAVELLVELEHVLPPGTDAETHRALVAEIRDIHRRKRNLAKLLDARWPPPPPAG